MPPKTASNNDEVATTVKALCYIMMSAEEFKPDMQKLAPLLGISAAKNVPRKINSIISPHGFEFKGNKIVAKDTIDIPATAAPADDTAAPAAKTKGTTAKTRKAKAPASKKRKLATTEEDDVEETAVASDEADKIEEDDEDN